MRSLAQRETFATDCQVNTQLRIEYSPITNRTLHNFSNVRDECQLPVVHSVYCSVCPPAAATLD